MPEADRQKARRAIAGYYAHIAALDDCVGDLLADAARGRHRAGHHLRLHLRPRGHALLARRPEQAAAVGRVDSRAVPAALPRRCWATKGRTLDLPINTPDIMPTLLGLCGIAIPRPVEGTDFSGVLTGKSPVPDDAALIACSVPFGQWTRARGGREYRGIRTRRYTYVRDLEGPWLLYDNEPDPYQLDNLCNKPRARGPAGEPGCPSVEEAQGRRTMSSFPASEYIRKWGYEVDESGTVRYTN